MAKLEQEEKIDLVKIACECANGPMSHTPNIKLVQRC